MMDNNVNIKANKWLGSNIDEESKAEIRELLKNNEALTEAFYKDLEFGTGGLRGIMGIGSNRMNKYTIGIATQGFANYLKKSFPGEEIKIAIAYDSRNNSRFFAETTAAVFSANNIKVYLFEELRPTPELSFAIRHLKCHAGVVLTASHNPKEYNGYKAYWNDGAQLVSSHDKNVINEVNDITSIDAVNFEANPTLIHKIGEEIDQKYLTEISKLSLSPEAIKRHHDVKIVYSSIHGTGITLVPRCLKELGFTQVSIVQEQAVADGNFPTVVYPNPEEKEALHLAMAQAKAVGAELLMATDPDADRVGIAIRNNDGEYELLNGNQTGSLLIQYILERWKELNQYKGNEFVVKTIVTTDLIEKIANHYGVTCYDTLTGFKYIAAKIKALEGKEQFIAGGEESYGYMIGDFVRDKDAIASCAMIAEMCAYAKSRGQSLQDRLLELYRTFGLYKETLISITKPGKAGMEDIGKMMTNFRKSPPTHLGGSEIVKILDYQSGEIHDFPRSNVLQFFTVDGYKVSIRPSGTEPKIKFYISTQAPLSHTDEYQTVSSLLDTTMARIAADLEKPA